MQTWSIKGMPVLGTILWKSEGCINVEHVDVYQKKPTPGLEGDWN